MNPMNLTIQARLYGTLALTVVLLIVIGSLSLLSARASIAQLDAMVAQRLTPADWLSTMQQHQGESLNKVVSVVGRHDVAALQSTADLLKERTASVNELWSKMLGLELTPRER